MKFRLTYEGELLSKQKGGGANHKHKIRRQMHKSLKELWATHAYLSQATVPVNEAEEKKLARTPTSKSYYSKPASSGYALMKDALALRHQMAGFSFVPLVRESLSLSCSLDILLLAPPPRYSIYHSGDIDNRLKTFIDALRMPSQKSELAGAKPTNFEKPFYCLLEDDKLLDRLTLEADTLYHSSKKTDSNWVNLVVAVEIRPKLVTMSNLSFA